MNKKIITSLLIISLLLVTGCGCSKKDAQKEEQNGNTNNTSNEEQTVVDNQIFEGLEFVNIGASDGVVKTVVINNTGVKYEGSKFSMKIMDENGNMIVELTDEVKEEMPTGTTKTIETKTNVDLSNAAAIEYSILSK